MTGIRVSALAGLLGLFWCGFTAQAADPRRLQIVISDAVPISSDAPGTRHVESWLAVNPRDSRNLIAASMVLGRRGGIVAYASFDRGKTWVRATHGSSKDPDFDGLDPAATFDTDGTAYLLTDGEELQAWKSTDGGRSWGGAAVVPGRAWDRPFVAVGPGLEPHSRRIFVAGKLPIKVFGHVASDVIAVSISEDGGLSFSFPRLMLPAPEKELLNVVSDLALTPDGQPMLALQLFPPQALRAPLLSGWFSTIAPLEGRHDFSEPRRAAKFHVYGHGWEGKSLFGIGAGKLAVDASRGPGRGRLYLAWLDVVDGFYQVMTAASGDGGATWSSPLRVNDNIAPADQSNPAIAVDGNGVVGVSWNDRRGDPTGRCFQTLFAASSNGAKSFSSNATTSDTKTCPTSAGVDPVESDYRFKNGGDTQGLVGLPAGGFQMAWINGASGELQLWSASISVEAPAERGKP